MKIPSNKVDRMVSPIPSPTPPTASLYGTLNRCYRSRHCSGIIHPSQNDITCGKHGNWRSFQGHPGAMLKTNEVEAGNSTSKISLWNQKSTVELPEPQRFGSLGRHEDRLIRKYLQRHTSMGSKSFLSEIGGDGMGYGHYGNR